MENCRAASDFLCRIFTVHCDESSHRKQDEAIVLAVCSTIVVFALLHFVLFWTTAQPRLEAVRTRGRDTVFFMIASVATAYLTVKIALAGALAVHALSIGLVTVCSASAVALLERRWDWIRHGLAFRLLLLWSFVAFFSLILLPKLLPSTAVDPLQSGQPIVPIFEGQWMHGNTMPLNASHVSIYFDDVHIRDFRLRVTGEVISSGARTTIEETTVTLTKERARILFLASTPTLRNVEIVCDVIPCLIFSEIAAATAVVENVTIVDAVRRTRLALQRLCYGESICESVAVPPAFLEEQPWPHFVAQRMPHIFHRLQTIANFLVDQARIVGQCSLIVATEVVVRVTPTLAVVFTSLREIFVATACAAIDVYRFVPLEDSCRVYRVTLREENEALFGVAYRVSHISLTAVYDAIEALPITDSLRYAAECELVWSYMIWRWLGSALSYGFAAWDVAYPIVSAWVVSLVGLIAEIVSWSFRFSFIGDETALHVNEWILCRLVEGAGPVVWGVCSAVVHYGSRVLFLYCDTSLVTHVAVILAQSALITVVLWREFRSKVHDRRSAVNWWRRVASVPTVVGESLNAYLKPLAMYATAHATAIILVVGTSIIPFSFPLYQFVLQFVLPLVSVRSWMLFFDGNAAWTDSLLSPKSCKLLCVRIAVCTVLQKSVGDVLYYVVMEVIFGLSAAVAAGLIVFLVARRRISQSQTAE